MNRHVEVIGLERVGHLPKSTQGIVSVRLLEAKGLLRFATFLEVEQKRRVSQGALALLAAYRAGPLRPNLGQTLGAPPVSFGDVVQGRDEAEGVVAVIAAVAQEQAVLFSAAAAHQTHNQIHLRRSSRKPSSPSATGSAIVKGARHETTTLTGLGRTGGTNFLYRDLNLSASATGSLSSTGSCFTRTGISFSAEEHERQKRTA